jgi:hypothetical protein
MKDVRDRIGDGARDRPEGGEPDAHTPPPFYTGGARRSSAGGRPTGVELAGALAEVSRQTLAKDFRQIDTASARVILVEGTARILGAYPGDRSARAREQLERLGVTVWTGLQITAIDAEGSVSDTGGGARGRFGVCGPRTCGSVILHL